MGLSGDALLKFVNDEREIVRKEIEEEREERRIARVEELKLENSAKDHDGETKTGNQSNQASGVSTPYHSKSGKRPKLPMFQEDRDSMDAFLLRFENYATVHGWDRDKEWAVNLSHLLTGKGLEAYSALSAEEMKNYDVLKTAILKRYRLTEDGFRSKFRAAKPENGETPGQFIFRLSTYATRWIELSETKKTYEELLNLIVKEQFLRSVHKDLSLFLKERYPKDLKAMASMAEKYLEAHGGWPNRPRSAPNQTSNNSSNNTKPQNTGQGHARPLKRTCFVCGKEGHLARNCRNRVRSTTAACVSEERNSNQGESSLDSEIPVNVTNHQSQTLSNEMVGSNPSETACMVHVIKGDCHIESALKEGEVTLQCGHKLPLLSAACSESKRCLLPVTPGFVGLEKVQVLRDTGCSGVVVRSNLVKDEQLTGETRTCVLIDNTVRRFPLAKISISTPYFTGQVKAMCMTNPVYDLVLGNIPEIAAADDKVVQSKFNAKNDKGIQTEVIHTRSFSTSTTEIVGTVETRGQLGKSKAFKPLRVSRGSQVLSVDDLKEAQNMDPTLRKCREMVGKGQETKNQGSTQKYFKKDGILMREFTNRKFEYGNTITQVVVPKQYRAQVMKLAHESILGGHQGANKTTKKVLSNFYWPGVLADVRRYCQSCDLCQRTAPKGRVTKVPLGEMPLIDAPFDRVGVDIVGPIQPCSERGHKYILVMMDYATRYPEATPMKTIEAERVAEELMIMFTRLGIPREILTDLGSQFTSGVMKELSRLLSIKNLTTTPYHPACNGLVERFNASLKSMLKKLCEEKPKDWDRYIAPILFAYRETPQDSTGFSPFELLYGRTIRGPMGILRELWTRQIDVPETKLAYQYVLDLKERLEETCKIAQKELAKNLVRYKKYYNRRARNRQFSAGEEVLLLLPTEKSKLLLQWKGPFRVVAKQGALDYKIALGSGEKTFHANLLKKYHRRDVEGTNDENTEAHSVLEVVCISVIEEEVWEDAIEKATLTNEDLLHMPSLKAQETFKDVKVSERLDQSQRQEVIRLLGSFQDVLTDLPGRTTLGEHKIRLIDQGPVRKKPYPIPHALRDKVKEEVNQMLQMGLIEHSESPYASPLVIVKKPDGSNRYCCDMRFINRKTIFDAEPIPDPEEIYTKLSKDHYFTKIDLTKGYYQVPMAVDSKQYTAFITHDGLYQFRVMPFGLVNAPATFSRIMRALLHGMSNVNNYIDDILIHTGTWGEHLTILKELLKRLRKVNLTARPKKCFVGYEEIEFLGHIVGHGSIRPKQEKTEAIRKAERPKTKKQLRSFLGLVGFYRRYIPNFAMIACPLTDLTKKGEPNNINWSESQELAFHTLKEKKR
ncbi:hypothetical protein HOLleu_29069 [Holothuria leucospilota]|uniref:Reverse transcriptase n=1 Tax=Holothuria leucospilota TaxID=206669 RepID=A0A9Q1BMX7_HOLLE|nr:hypothetical protein HOLleu_29069 [Holothuria leucospilota]